MGAADLTAEVKFTAPGQATSTLAVENLDWALILFANRTSLDGEMAWPGGAEGTNLTLTRARAMYADGYGVESTILETPGQRSYGRIEASIWRPMGDWSSLYIEGGQLRLWANQTLAQIKASPAGDCVFDLMTAKEFSPQPARTGALCHASDNAVLALRPTVTHDAMAFNVTGEGLRVVEWHNLHNECPQSECPAEGARRTEWSNPSAPRVARETRAYERLTGDDGEIFATGTASVILTGSRALGVHIDGWLRMPAASGLDSCPSCQRLGGRTLQVQGNVDLADLRMEQNGSLSAMLGGDFEAARLDEVAIDPKVLLGAGAAAGVAVAVVGLVLLLKLLVGFTRIESDNAVVHPRRRSIHDYIRTRPGAGFREIMRETKSSSTSVHRHLEILKLTGHIVEERHGRSRRFFPSALQGKSKEALLLRELPLAKLYDLVERNPWLSQGEIMDLAERELASSRSTTQHRLGRLLNGGLLRVQKRGRYLLHATASQSADAASSSGR